MNVAFYGHVRQYNNIRFAETLTGGGWRAVTKTGSSSGEGCMNYDLDMFPYIQEMADWLDDGAKVHPCNFESAYKGFEIMKPRDPKDRHRADPAVRPGKGIGFRRERRRCNSPSCAGLSDLTLSNMR
jgi:hypothetical protein